MWVIHREPARQTGTLAMSNPLLVPFQEFVGPHMVSDLYGIDGRRDPTYQSFWEAASDYRNIGLPIAILQTATDDFYSVCEVQATGYDHAYALLTVRGDVVGFYVDAHIWIDESLRGNRLASRMIAAVAAINGTSPTRSVLGLGFTPAALAAHRAAHRHLVMDALLNRTLVPEPVVQDYALENWLSSCQDVAHVA